MLLIISKNKKTALDVAEVFYFMGYLAHGTTPHSALSEISTQYRAAVVVNPEVMPDAEDFVSRLRQYSSDVPVFAICQADGSDKYSRIFDDVYRSGTFSPTLASGISQFLDSKGLPRIGDYRLSGIDASVNRMGVYYFSTRLRFTKTEVMILRYLIRSYPIPRDTKDILNYAYRPSRCPETAGIRTHISLMNKKFRELFDRNIIGSLQGRGYVILTPEVMEENNLW